MTVCQVILMISYVTFVYKYPQECSMNFRYITLTILFPALGLGLEWDSLSQTVKRTVTVIAAAFVLCAVAMTAVWGIIY